MPTAVAPDVPVPETDLKANGAAVKSSGKPVPGYSSRLTDGRAMALDVWSVFNAASFPADCINLGQGYMNFNPPRWVTEAANEALSNVGPNHYSLPKGRPRLREAIAKFYEPSFLGRKINADTEVLVTSGANEGQYSMFVAFLEHGDEVIMFEPYFDQYVPSVTFNGGVPVYVPLHPPTVDGSSTSNDWTIDFEELKRAITPKTKMLILNTPHNPVGKVFTRHELEQIAALAIEHNFLVQADEVYDCIVFDGVEHIRIANLPGMWERTVTVGSAGKAFAATGWRVGWLIGPPHLIRPTLAACTRIIFCTNSPLQEAAAAGLEQAVERKYFETQAEEYVQRRDCIVRAFEKLGVKYTLPQGSYFILMDISNMKFPSDFEFPESIKGRGKDFQACWFIALEIGVACIPVSEFYVAEHCHIGEAYARFAFCKDLDTLEKAGERLQALKKYMV